ncbi:MAG TPA: hypothetical protein VIA81_01955 [Acidimicrobiia bacterium]|jgi:MFS family permease
MPEILIGLAAMVAVATAIRSIWSPCGLSMLSTITPMAEATRGHRFASTARWFVLGSVVGGATLGVVIAGLVLAVNAIGIGEETSLVVAALAALITATSDGRIGGFRLPGHDRQVNERWLDRYRSWVYGAGFGWQIGVGLATYIMTAGIYLLIVMGALLVNPLLAVGIGVLFGLVRGLAVYMAAELDTQQKLVGFHARFEEKRELVRRTTIVVQALVAVAAIWTATSLVTAVAVSALALAVVVVSLRGPKETLGPAVAWS